jgi:hypothetical protein
MESTMSQKLDQMLNILRTEGPTRGDQLPNNGLEFFQLAEPDPESELEPGLSLRALEQLKSKLDAGAPLTDLEAFGANVLRIMAHQLNWAPTPRRPAPVEHLVTHHTATISGSYTIAGTLAAFKNNLKVELLSGGFAKLLETRVASCELKEGQPGLQVVLVEVVLTFQVRRRKDLDAPLDAILDSIEALISHPRETLAPVPRMLKSIGLCTA